MLTRKVAGLVVALMLAGSAAFGADLYGIVADKDGKPTQATVVLKNAQGNPVGAPVTTDKTGAYAFKNIKPGTYQVQVGDKNDWKIFVGPGETRRDLTLK